jgi:MFS family permease
MALLSPLAGKMSDRVSPFKLSTIGMALCAVSMFMFLFLGIDTPLFYIIVCLLIAGIGFGFFSSPNTNAVMLTITKRDTGVATSILNSMRSIGQISSMAIITIVMHFTLGDAVIEEAGAPAIVNTMNIVFIACLAICVVGILLSFGRKSEKNGKVK